MRFATLLLILLIVSSCSNSKETKDNMDQEYPESELVQGKLIRKKMYNKAGRELPGAGDFFLVLNGKETFVKMMESKVSVNQLEPLLDQKATYRIIRGDGLWDTDDPNVQSRIGPYVAILEIVDN